MSDLYDATAIPVTTDPAQATAVRPSILVALDGSKAAEASLPYAEGLAQCSGSVLHLVYALGKGLSAVPSAWEIDDRHEAMRRSESYLTQTAADIRARGLYVETLLREGQAANAIVQAGDECGSTLVALTSHGHGDPKRWLLGTTAEAVLCQRSRPVLLIHQIPGRDHEFGAVPRKVLVPLDGSPQAEAALPAAVTLAASACALLVLAHVVALEGSEEERVAREYLDGVALGLGGVGAMETVILRGRPAESVIQYARGHGVDLIVMSDRGYRSAPRTILGIVVDSMERSGIPILLIPPGLNQDSGESIHDCPEVPVIAAPG